MKVLHHRNIFIKLYEAIGQHKGQSLVMRQRCNCNSSFEHVSAKDKSLFALFRASRKIGGWQCPDTFEIAPAVAARTSIVEVDVRLGGFATEVQRSLV